MERRPPNSSNRPLVLLLEDHEDTRAMYALGLLASGFEVVAMTDSAVAITRVWNLHPDIIVTDLAMPNGDGWQFLQDLKRDSRTRTIPVVAISGHVGPAVRERAERDGFAAFFAKPCLPDALAAGLRRVLDRQAHAHVER